MQVLILYLRANWRYGCRGGAKLAFFKRGIHALPIYGGQSYERQFDGLRQGAQIVIGTPGRVMDHMRRGTLRLDKVKMAILDEVDVMLDMGFRDDIEVITSWPKEQRTVRFSATIPRAIQELIQKYSRDPQSVKIEQKELTVPTVEQVYYEVDRRFKIELLTRLIDIHDLKLGGIISATQADGGRPGGSSERAGLFRECARGRGAGDARPRDEQVPQVELEFLVATDVAARGIDVNDVQVVFNYDLPYDAEDYVHRIEHGPRGPPGDFLCGGPGVVPDPAHRALHQVQDPGKPPTENGEVVERGTAFLEKLRATLRAANTAPGSSHRAAVGGGF